MIQGDAINPLQLIFLAAAVDDIGICSEWLLTKENPRADPLPRISNPSAKGNLRRFFPILLLPKHMSLSGNYISNLARRLLHPSALIPPPKFIGSRSSRPSLIAISRKKWPIMNTTSKDPCLSAFVGAMIPLLGLHLPASPVSSLVQRVLSPAHTLATDPTRDFFFFFFFFSCSYSFGGVFWSFRIASGPKYIFSDSLLSGDHRIYLSTTS